MIPSPVRGRCPVPRAPSNFEFSGHLSAIDHTESQSKMHARASGATIAAQTSYPHRRCHISTCRTLAVCRQGTQLGLSRWGHAFHKFYAMSYLLVASAPRHRWTAKPPRLHLAQWLPRIVKCNHGGLTSQSEEAGARSRHWTIAAQLRGMGQTRGVLYASWQRAWQHGAGRCWPSAARRPSLSQAAHAAAPAARRARPPPRP